MKKLFLTVLAVGLFGYSSMAQAHLELGLNFNSPAGDFGDQYDLGVGFYLEPKYAMNENIDLGLLISSNAFAGGDLSGSTASVSALGMLVIEPTVTYRFSTSSVTPYGGLGIGYYSVEGVEISGFPKGDRESKIGFAPRAGVYVGRLNLGLAYNIVSDFNFLQFNLGVRILSR